MTSADARLDQGYGPRPKGVGAPCEPSVATPPKKAELVALGIDRHHPRDVTAADIDAPGAERDEPLRLLGLIGAGRADVDVHAVLDRLRLRDLHEHKDQAAVRRISGLRQPDDVILSLQLPAENICPELRDAVGVRAVDVDLGDDASHTNEV